MNTEYIYAKVVGVNIEEKDNSVYIRAEKNKVLIGKIAYLKETDAARWIAMDMPLSYLKILGMPEIGDSIKITYSGNGRAYDGTASLISKPRETNASVTLVEEEGNDTFFGMF